MEMCLAHWPGFLPWNSAEILPGQSGGKKNQQKIKLICSHQHKKLEIKTTVNSKDGYGN